MSTEPSEPRTELNIYDKFEQFVMKLVLEKAFRRKFEVDRKGTIDPEFTDQQKEALMDIKLTDLESVQVKDLHDELDKITGYRGPTIRG